MTGPIETPLGRGFVGPTKACIRQAFTLATPGEYERMIRARRRCGLTPNYFVHLLNQLLTMAFAEHIKNNADVQHPPKTADPIEMTFAGTDWWGRTEPCLR